MHKQTALVSLYNRSSVRFNPYCYLNNNKPNSFHDAGSENSLRYKMALKFSFTDVFKNLVQPPEIMLHTL